MGLTNMIELLPQYPRIVPDRDKYRKWYLDEDVRVRLFNGHTFIIPKGYRFDGHSVPKLLRWLFPRHKGLDIYAALLHDYLIDVQMFLRYTRAFQDTVYTIMMQNPLYTSSNFRSVFMPRAVKTFGFLKHTLWGDYRGDPKIGTELIIKLNEYGTN